MKYIDIVFIDENKGNREPSPPKLEFVEVENAQGESVGVGRWIDREDGFTVLRLFDDATKAMTDPLLDVGTIQPSEKSCLTALAEYVANLDVANTQRGRVWRMIRDAGLNGVTDSEVQYALDMTACTEHPRRGELVAKGLVENSGRLRATLHSGRKAIVWRVVA